MALPLGFLLFSAAGFGVRSLFNLTGQLLARVAAIGVAMIILAYVISIFISATFSWSVAQLFPEHGAFQQLMIYFLWVFRVGDFLAVFLAVLPVRVLLARIL